jgi:hypothetical protein
MSTSNNGKGATVMSTEKQIAANRKNAGLGGPKTPDGKAAVARNARKHGIFAAALTFKDHEDLHSIYETFREQYVPVGLLEETLLEKLALTYLRLQRCARAEAVCYKNTWHKRDHDFGHLRAQVEERYGKSASDSIAFRFEEFQKMVNTFAKYDATLTNQFGRLMRDFLALQNSRRTHPPEHLPDSSGSLPSPQSPLPSPQDAATLADLSSSAPAQSDPLAAPLDHRALFEAHPKPSTQNQDSDPNGPSGATT